MTEIPEHLLKRSRERREAAGLPTDGGAAPTNSVPAVAAPAAAPAKAAAPAAPSAPPPAPKAKPVPAYIQAANTRKKMPFWAMSALSMLPLWAFVYVRGVQPEAEKVEGPMAIGAEIYKKCSSCHNADGSGGAGGRPMWNGEVLKTFPLIESQLNWVYHGTVGYEAADLDIYGDPDREGGARGVRSLAEMPAQGIDAGGALSDVEILGVVCHERYKLGGADPVAEEWAEEFEEWCSPEAEMFHKLEEGEKLGELEGVGAVAGPAEAGAEG